MSASGSSLFSSKLNTDIFMVSIACSKLLFKERFLVLSLFCSFFICWISIFNFCSSLTFCSFRFSISFCAFLNLSVRSVTHDFRSVQSVHVTPVPESLPFSEMSSSLFCDWKYPIFVSDTSSLSKSGSSESSQLSGKYSFCSVWDSFFGLSGDRIWLLTVLVLNLLTSGVWNSSKGIPRTLVEFSGSRVAVKLAF